MAKKRTSLWYVERVYDNQIGDWRYYIYVWNSKLAAFETIPVRYATLEMTYLAAVTWYGP